MYPSEKRNQTNTSTFYPNLRDLDCDSDDINVVNQFIALENIPSGEATINFEPIIIEFDLNIEPNLYECNIHFQSNTNSYIQYSESFLVEFDVNDFPILLGDINEDGIIDILDVIVCVNIVIELVEPTLSQLLTSDINQDGNTNVQDIILMVNLILN